MYSNTVHIEIEDLHAGTVERGKSRFINYNEAVEYSLKLNDYYAKNAIPRIASAKG